MLWLICSWKTRDCLFTMRKQSRWRQVEVKRHKSVQQQCFKKGIRGRGSCFLTSRPVIYHSYIDNLQLTIKTSAGSKGSITDASGPPVLHRGCKWKQLDFNLQQSVMKFDSAKQPSLLIRHPWASLPGQGLSFWLSLSSISCRSTKPGGSLIRQAYCINAAQHNTQRWRRSKITPPPNLCLFVNRKLSRQMFGNTSTPFEWWRPLLTLDDISPQLQWQNAVSSWPIDIHNI